MNINPVCTKISTGSLVYRVLVSKAVFYSKFLLSVENPHLKFNLSEIFNLSTERAFVVKKHVISA